MGELDPADGSQIRSLSGRSAQLGDGYNRNPKDRDAILEQRTRDLQGRTGQLRGFNMDEFLRDYQENTSALPWTVGDDAVPDISAEERLAPRAASYAPGSSAQGVSVSKAVRPRMRDSGGPYSGAVIRAMAEAGVPKRLKVVLVTDYGSGEEVEQSRVKWTRQVSLLFPHHKVSVSASKGPFEDVLSSMIRTKRG